ncbi:hypothetical protein PGTUg99_017930 [Puccinia graminis f. sp. tritici]|uniref:Glucanase n=1 Tax=Puccinia graminis f. sp. tritici TaxID=56615 RepID=A0A5B0M715_PUCGR|nr:hypothetical protein PGTUg99_017930 [Puccinia graminis f. sp. tritici]
MAPALTIRQVKKAVQDGCHEDVKCDKKGVSDTGPYGAFVSSWTWQNVKKCNNERMYCSGVSNTSCSTYCYRGGRDSCSNGGLGSNGGGTCNPGGSVNVSISSDERTSDTGSDGRVDLRLAHPR